MYQIVEQQKRQFGDGLRGLLLILLAYFTSKLMYLCKAFGNIIIKLVIM